MSSCPCGKFSLEEAVIKPAPSKFQTTGFANETFGYYCGNCDRFHHVIQEEQSVVRGPVNARALLHAEVKLNGQQIITWSVGDQSSKERHQVQTVEFFPWPRRFPMTETEPLIHLTWNLLMSKVEIIVGQKPEPGVGDTTAWMQARNEARGIAEVLAIQMKPFMETADDVVRAAISFYNNPHYEVPGLGNHLWDPMMNPDGSPRTPISSPRTERPKPAIKVKAQPKETAMYAGRKLSDSDKEGVAAALNSGMFSAEDLRDMYKVPLSEIEALRS